MIKQVRMKFIITGLIAATLITVALILSIYLVSAAQTNKHLDQVLLDISGYDLIDNEIPRGRSRRREDRMSSLIQYGGRFFAVTTDSTGVAFLYSDELPYELLDLTEEVVSRGKEKGSINSYRYLLREEDGFTNVFFLDCLTEMSERRTLLFISIIVGAAGILLSFAFIFYTSGKIVMPLKESMDKQKRFITDAGHELKTPISVISTNMDLLEMDVGENEWLDGSRKQLGKLTHLVGDLISLARMDEGRTVYSPSTFDISSAAEESAVPFEEIARSKGKTLHTEISQSLYAKADEAQVRQLFTILCDNAVKYGIDEIYVRLYLKGKKIFFETSNAWDREKAPEKLETFFDRFYRADASRDRRGGGSGYGLGLSIAEGIAHNNNIQLKVFEDEQQHLVFSAVFSQASAS